MSAHSGPDIVEDGLVLYLDAANEKSYPGSGTTWYDVSGNQNNATIINGTVFNNTNQSGFIFDGVNDFCLVPNSISTNISGTNIALEVICKSDALSNSFHGDGLISKGSGGNDGQYEIMLVPSASKNTAFFRCAGMGSYSPKTILMDIGQIYVVTCVLDSAFMRIFINGVEDGTGQQKDNSIISRTQSVTIGSRHVQAGFSSSAFAGTIYNVKVYNRSLTESEIQQNFNALRSRYNL